MYVYKLKSNIVLRKQEINFYSIYHILIYHELNTPFSRNEQSLIFDYRRKLIYIAIKFL